MPDEQVVSRQYLDDPQFQIGFWRVARSVLIFLGAPLVAAVLTRAVGVSSRLLTNAAAQQAPVSSFGAALASSS